MRIGVKCLLDATVAEVATDGNDGHTLVDEQRGAAVAQVVDADPLHACRVGRLMEAAVNGDERERIRTAEHEGVGSGLQLISICTEHITEKLRKVDSAVTADILWHGDRIPLAGITDLVGYALVNVYGAAVEVDVLPRERSIEADKDKDGKAISGTKKRKLQTFVNSLRLSAAEKYMVMGYLGYSNANGEGTVKAHISKLNLSKSEKTQLLKYSGYGA